MWASEEQHSAAGNAELSRTGKENRSNISKPKDASRQHIAAGPPFAFDGMPDRLGASPNRVNLFY